MFVVVFVCLLVCLVVWLVGGFFLGGGGVFVFYFAYDKYQTSINNLFSNVLISVCFNFNCM